MPGKIKKIIAGAIALISVVVAIFAFFNIVSITNAISSGQAAWIGGVSGSLSATDFPVVGNDVSTPANSVMWWLPGQTFTLLVATTPAQQEQGLGDISQLASTSGMFFVFNTPGDYAFWMKGMEFPLDIIWLDQDFKITHIERGLLPSTYPKTFSPGAQSQYVIEVNAGVADEFSLDVGQTMQIYQK
jgi:uncharacterized membrane protein (UPF0127 family)